MVQVMVDEQVVDRLHDVIGFIVRYEEPSEGRIYAILHSLYCPKGWAPAYILSHTFAGNKRVFESPESINDRTISFPRAFNRNSQMLNYEV